MTELETMQRAKMYIDKLANGIDPITDEPVPENDTVNNVRVSRCLFYVSEVLGKVIANGGEIKTKKTTKAPFSISEEQKMKYVPSEKPISVSDMVNKLNELAEVDETGKKLQYKNVSEWLVEVGALEVITLDDGKKTKLPTAQGLDLGISVEQRNGMYGEYTAVVYNADAQSFIIDNLDAIIARILEKDAEKAAAKAEKKQNQGAPWTDVDDEELTTLFKSGRSIPQIAEEMKRSYGGVRARLEKLGFELNRG